MNVLGMFGRLPVAGRTKTRLAADVGAQAAADLYAGFVEDLLDRCGALADQFVMAVTPKSDECEAWFYPRLPDRAALWFQPDGDLGCRIDAFFQHAFELTSEDADGSKDRKVVLIGSDSPDLPTSILTRAFGELEHHDVVLGPAADGGFTLIGLRQLVTGLWHDVPFSCATTLLATLRSAARLGLQATLLPLWYDVDTIDNLGALQSLQEFQNEAAPCPRTLKVLQRLDRSARAT
ncbi:MAG: TIGR04282 family arsenosugar biosynthesis glycosyltransferase [Fuerstiella sp.]